MDDPALLSKLYPSSFLDAFLDTKVRVTQTIPVDHILSLQLI